MLKPSESARLQVYAEAGGVFKALDERLRGGGGGGGRGGARFFFGDRPSSLDALLFAHLLYLQGAPVSAPELRSKVRAAPVMDPDPDPDPAYGMVKCSRRISMCWPSDVRTSS